MTACHVLPCQHVSASWRHSSCRMDPVLLQETTGSVRGHLVLAVQNSYTNECLLQPCTVLVWMCLDNFVCDQFECNLCHTVYNILIVPYCFWLSFIIALVIKPLHILYMCSSHLLNQYTVKIHVPLAWPSCIHTCLENSQYYCIFCIIITS